MASLQKAFSLFFLVACFTFAAIFFEAWNNPGRGVPPKSELSNYAGTLEVWTQSRYDIEFKLVGSPISYRYLSKSDGYEEIKSALIPGIPIALLGKRDSGNAFNKATNIVTVYEVSISGKTVRSYEDIKLAWINNDKIGILLVILFGFGGPYLCWKFWPSRKA